MATKAEIKLLNSHIKYKIRTGDKVIIIAGKDKGQAGFVAAVAPKEQKVIVLQDNPENPEQPIPLNAVIKHRKAKTQGEKSARFKMPAAIHISNVMVIDPKTGEGTRVGRRKEGEKLVRYAKKSGETIKDTPNIVKKD
ncbi:MAG: 50S ribosomal protein L24 [Armatimonadetes bacterium]|nr:50S ribosomal protein L24 [Armatimonadota bacterium]